MERETLTEAQRETILSALRGFANHVSTPEHEREINDLRAMFIDATSITLTFESEKLEG